MHCKLIFTFGVIIIFVNIILEEIKSQEASSNVKRILVRRIRKLPNATEKIKTMYSLLDNNIEKKISIDTLGKSIINVRNYPSAMKQFNKEAEMLGALFNQRRIEKMLEGKSGDL